MATLDDSLDDDLAHSWTERQNDAGPVFMSRRFQGKYEVLPRVRSHVFVAARIELNMSEGQSACTGCTRAEETPLLEAGLVQGLSPGAGARRKGLFGPDLIITTIR